MKDPLAMNVTPLESFPPIGQWDDWVEYDAGAWPKRVEKHYRLVPTTCFNCEAACGLVAYIDRDDYSIRRLEGNPFHPGSRGKNCAKGPATLNQIHDPQRILGPMKRVGPRGSGRFEPCTWEHVIEVFAAKIRAAIVEGRKTEVMYHVGRPGHDGYMDRVLQSWGVDGHNSHTNVCSAAARLGYALWSGADRPSPDHENAKFMLLISSHLETGHYFNPHAQRIVEGQMRGAKIAVIDVRLSNTASRADYWLAPWPGTEAFLLLSMAHVLLAEDLVDRKYLEDWTNWRDYLRARRPDAAPTFAGFLEQLKLEYASFTPEAAEAECGVPRDRIVTVARHIGAAGSAFASHVWRSAASGNEGGWQVARCLSFLTVLVGAVGAKGGTNPNSSDKFVPPPFLKPPPQDVWSDLLYPKDWPLSHHELSFLLPHLMYTRGGKLSAYFTRVYNPVWTNPDGLMWEKLLKDEERIELHACLTPIWSETAQYADYVLPMGLGPERHDLMSQETHAAKWISFRQPVLRAMLELDGKRVDCTRDTNPGEVWEEDEFWIELSWAIDPDGSLGIRKYYESPYNKGEKIAVPEYYRWIFENSVPGLKEEAAKHDLTPLQYMRRHGAFLVEEGTWQKHTAEVSAAAQQGATQDQARADLLKDGQVVGVLVDGKPRVGFNTPSRRLEIFSRTMADFGWPEHATPGYIESQIHRRHLDRERGEYCLVPTFRLPTLIHTRSGNSKWLYELSNTNPLWVHPEDAERLSLATTDLVRVTTRIGHFVNRTWVTEGMRPGVVACSHHLGRWRLFDDVGTDRWAAAKVVREDLGEGRVRFRRIEDIGPFHSKDPDSKRVWWTDGGVHQNLTFPVQPDPVSGMHCWHQVVKVEPAHEGDRYGDVEVDLSRSLAVFDEWLRKARPGPYQGLRRPLHFARAVRPTNDAYRLT